MTKSPPLDFGAAKREPTARVARMPGQRSKAADSTSHDPREFDERIDVVHELRANYQTYTEDADAWFEVSSFPGYLRTALDKIQARTFQVGSKPSRAAVICCCLGHGLAALYEHPTVAGARTTRDDFYKTDFDDAEAEETVASWLQVMKVEVGLAGGGPRLAFRLSDALKGELFGLASELGVSAASVAMLAIMLTLCNQEAVHPDQRVRMAEGVSTFLRRLHLRAAGTRALMEILR